MDKRIILGLKILFGGMSLYMVYLVTVTSMQSNMFQLPSDVVNEPWFQTTLYDFYFNITILSTWAIYKEKKLAVALVWVLGFILLGSIATCFYVYLQLSRLKSGDSLDKIFLRNK
jgi:predicted permease